MGKKMKQGLSKHRRVVFNLIQKEQIKEKEKEMRISLLGPKKFGFIYLLLLPFPQMYLSYSYYLNSIEKKGKNIYKN